MSLTFAQKYWTARDRELRNRTVTLFSCFARKVAMIVCQQQQWVQMETVARVTDNLDINTSCLHSNACELHILPDGTFVRYGDWKMHIVPCALNGDVQHFLVEESHPYFVQCSLVCGFREFEVRVPHVVVSRDPNFRHKLCLCCGQDQRGHIVRSTTHLFFTTTEQIKMPCY